MVAEIKAEEGRIVVIGARGMLGSELCRVFPGSIGLSRAELDITDREAVIEKLSLLKPDVVINAAAYTKVEDAEIEKKEAFRVNSEAVLNIALACKSIGAVLVHFSTDYVFDGGNSQGYSEDDDTHAINVYGKSKLGGEENIRRTLDEYMIVRTSGLFGENGKNFVDTIVRLARDRSEIKVVDDQFVSPTYAWDLADAVQKLVFGDYPFGVYHITNSGSCSWFEFAGEIVRLARLDCKVVPCGSSEYPSRLERPKYSLLNNSRFEKMPAWDDALNRYLSCRGLLNT